MSELPYFRSGEVPRAADFARLVAAVRELMPSGVCDEQRRRVAAGGRYYFTIGGRGRVVSGANGFCTVGVASMSWWQCGVRTETGRVRVMMGTGALAEAREAHEVLGVHGELSWAETGDMYGSVRTVDSVSYAVARWRGVDDGAGGEWPGWHGESECWGAQEVTVRGKSGVWMQQWAQPEVCEGVWLQELPLSAGEVSELLVGATAGFSVEVARAEYADGRVFTWRAKLDARGRLGMSFKQYGPASA